MLKVKNAHTRTANTQRRKTPRVQALWNIVQAYLLQLNMPCGPVLLLSIYTSEKGVFDHQKTRSKKLIVALFTIAEDWKSLKYINNKMHK